MRGRSKMILTPPSKRSMRIAPTPLCGAEEASLQELPIRKRIRAGSCSGLSRRNTGRVGGGTGTHLAGAGKTPVRVGERQVRPQPIGLLQGPVRKVPIAHQGRPGPEKQTDAVVGRIEATTVGEVAGRMEILFLRKKTARVAFREGFQFRIRGGLVDIPQPHRRKKVHVQHDPGRAPLVQPQHVLLEARFKGPPGRRGQNVLHSVEGVADPDEVAAQVIRASGSLGIMLVQIVQHDEIHGRQHRRPQLQGPGNPGRGCPDTPSGPPRPGVGCYVLRWAAGDRGATREPAG